MIEKTSLRDEQLVSCNAKKHALLKALVLGRIFIVSIKEVLFFFFTSKGNVDFRCK